MNKIITFILFALLGCSESQPTAVVDNEPSTPNEICIEGTVFQDCTPQENAVIKISHLMPDNSDTVAIVTDGNGNYSYCWTPELSTTFFEVSHFTERIYVATCAPRIIRQDFHKLLIN